MRFALRKLVPKITGRNIKKEIGQDTRYLAVQSDVIFSDEIPNLYAKLVNSPGVNSSALEDFENNNELDVYCVN
jgi:hypothetical protein